MSRQYSRRALLGWSLRIPAAGIGAAAFAAACAQKPGADAASAGGAPVCVDPANLTSSEASLRQTNGYVEKSADPAKTCAGCAFFTPAADGSNCGTCQIFVGGPANAQGYCASWAAKSSAPGSAAPASAPPPAAG